MTMSYAVIDTEGSGVFDFKKPADAPGQPRMAALGLILVNSALEIETEHGFLIRPDGWTFDDNCDAAKINGLTHERLMAEGVPAREALSLYDKAIDQRRIVVAFNAPHDLKTLRAELRYTGYPDRYMETRYICAMQGCRQIVDARTADGKKKAPRLEEAVKHFEIEVPGDIHSALPDAHKALAILRKLRDLRAFPAFVDPYTKGKKPKVSATQYARESQAMREQPDFLGARNGGFDPNE
jgi:DNA polymerase III subunit epsilon